MTSTPEAARTASPEPENSESAFQDQAQQHSGERIAFLDNARYWMMLLVVIGHPLFYLTSMHSARTLYYWMYLFHMPLFALICGYVSRNFSGTPEQLRRTVSALVVPYFIVETSYQVLHRQILEHNGHPMSGPMMLLSPKWIAWFLAALFVWRMVTPLLRALRYPILTSIVISLLVPLTEVPNVVGIPKAVGMLPFYVVGMQMSMDTFKRLAETRVRIASGVVLAVAMVVCWFGAPHWSLSWLKWRHRYDEGALNVGAMEGILHRSTLLAVGVLLSLAVLSLVPWRRSWTSPLGERTLYCYLLHGFVVVMLAQWWHLFDHIKPWGGWAIVATIAAAVVLGTFLMTKPVATVFRPLFEPELTWLFKKRSKDKEILAQPA